MGTHSLPAEVKEVVRWNESVTRKEESSSWLVRSQPDCNSTNFYFLTVFDSESVFLLSNSPVLNSSDIPTSLPCFPPLFPSLLPLFFLVSPSSPSHLAHLWPPPILRSTSQSFHKQLKKLSWVEVHWEEYYSLFPPVCAYSHSTTLTPSHVFPEGGGDLNREGRNQPSEGRPASQWMCFRPQK